MAAAAAAALPLLLHHCRHPRGVELASSRRESGLPPHGKMLIPKKNRREVYKYLFKGGCVGCC
jgi:hypothetical protein